MRRKATHNSTYKKLAVQWLNEVLCFVSSSVLADSIVLRIRQLLVAAKRYLLFHRNTTWTDNMFYVEEKGLIIGQPTGRVTTILTNFVL
jgi:hypothetical protein